MTENTMLAFAATDVSVAWLAWKITGRLVAHREKKQAEDRKAAAAKEKQS